MKRWLAAAVSPERPLLLHVACVWLLASAIAIIANWQQLPALAATDPDDHLRLVQVRDWLAGQSWWDVSQARINPPEGGNMHWSRLVDVPIAGLILLFSTIVGREVGEATAMAIVPLLILGAVMAVMAASARALLDRGAALLATVLIVANPFLVHQLAPLRIDHHGWQILMAGLCLWALLREERLGSGLIAGAALAFWAHISAEALPHIALVGALLAARYVLDPAERPRFAGYLIGIAAGSLILFAATQPIGRWTTAYCDAISWVHLMPMTLMAGLAGLTMVRGLTGTPLARAGLIGVVSAAAGALFVLGGSSCLAGPFGNLAPLVRDYWYSHVLEGLPIWRQESNVFAMIWSVIFGGIGTWLAWRSAADAAARRRWATLAILLAGSSLVGLAVVRALGVANLYAMPGCAFLLLTLLRRVRPIPKVALRLPLTVAVIFAATPTFALMGSERMRSAKAAETPAIQGPRCATKAGLAGLATLPHSRVLAPLDIGPALLAFTPHSIMATGHHRNDRIMSEVISLWLGDAANARRFVAKRGVDLVAYCRRLPEVELYAADSPQGFLAQLERGQVPPWLERVETGRSKDLRVYRVKR